MAETKIKAVFTIIEADNMKKPLFRRIGTGFVNRDGSLNVILDALPVNGKLHIRDAVPYEKGKKEKSGRSEASDPGIDVEF